MVIYAVIISRLQLNGKPLPYTMAVPDKMIEALGGWPGNASKQKLMVAITMLLSLLSPVCIK